MGVLHWTASERTNKMTSTANKKFTPLIIPVDASNVQMIRTSD